MNERKIAQEGYVINGFKPFSQLAMEYFPGNQGIDLSRKRMRERIDEDLALAAKLSEILGSTYQKNPAAYTNTYF